MKLCLQPLDPDVEMPITSMNQTRRDRGIAWQVTFKKEVTMEGRTFRPGDAFERNATLRKSGDSWLVDGM